LKSVNHELDIAVWREAIELDASKDASARNELDKLAEALKKHKAEKAAKKKLYDAAVKRYNTASTKLKEAKAAVAKLLKAKKEIEGKVDELEELYRDAKKKQGSTEQDLELYENELEKLIKQRERQPVGAIKNGWECQLWYAFKHGIQKPNNNQQWRKYEAFDFTSTPDKTFTMPHMNFGNRGQLERGLRQGLKDNSFKGEYFLMKMTGVFVAPEDDTYTFRSISDDGSYLYLGQQPLANNKAIV